MNYREPRQVPEGTKNNYTQAGRVFTKFGNARRLKMALDDLADHTKDDSHRREYTAVCRWNKPKGQWGGRDGLIPSSAMISVLKAARLKGIVLTERDLAPTPISKG